MEPTDKKSAQSQKYRVDRVSLRLKHPEEHVSEQESVGHVNTHMKGFPDRCSQVGQPEVLTGGSHEKQDRERTQSQNLERVLPGPRVQIRDKQRLEQAEIGACMVSQEYQNAMGKAEQKRGHPQVAAIVEQGQPA